MSPKSKVKISIAMCTYNGEKYISEQLESLLSQSIHPFELVICDDGSTDTTLKIVKEYAKIAPFKVRVFENEKNYNFTGNFLRAASLCEGDVIAFCDQDDIWEKEKIEVCIDIFERYTPDLVIHEGRVIDKIGSKTSIKIPRLKETTEKLLAAPFDQIAKGFAMLVTYEVIEEILASWDWKRYFAFTAKYGPPLGHDLFIFAWCNSVKDIRLVDMELVRYRIHDHNLTASQAVSEGFLQQFKAFFERITFDHSAYQLPGQKWAAEVVFLENYLNRCESKSHPGISCLAQHLDEKSQLWLRRSSIYERGHGRLTRWGSIIQLIAMGGYLSSKKTRFGFRALWKDAFIATFK